MSLKGFGKAAVRVHLVQRNLFELTLLLTQIWAGAAKLQAKIQYCRQHARLSVPYDCWKIS